VGCNDKSGHNVQRSFSRICSTVQTDRALTLKVVSAMRMFTRIADYVDSGVPFDFDAELSCISSDIDGARICILATLFCLPHSRQSTRKIRSSVSAIVSYIRARQLSVWDDEDFVVSDRIGNMDWQDGFIELGGLGVIEFMAITNQMLDIATHLDFIRSEYTIDVDDMASRIARAPMGMLALIMACMFSIDLDSPDTDYHVRMTDLVQEFISSRTSTVREPDLMSHSVSAAFLVRPNNSVLGFKSADKGS
jgi:hypothetical protein